MLQLLLLVKTGYVYLSVPDWIPTLAWTQEGVQPRARIHYNKEVSKVQRRTLQRRLLPKQADYVLRYSEYVPGWTPPLRRNGVDKK